MAIHRSERQPTHHRSRLSRIFWPFGRPEESATHRLANKIVNVTRHNTGKCRNSAHNQQQQPIRTAAA